MKDIKKIKKIKPMFTSILTTCDKYRKTDGIILDLKNTEGSIKEYQTVLAVGDSVRSVKEGDVVCINPRNYEVRKFQDNSMNADIQENRVVRYDFNIINVDGNDCLMIQDRDIDFIIEDYE